MKKIPAFPIVSILLAASIFTGCGQSEEARTRTMCGGNGIVGGKSVGDRDFLSNKVVMVRARLNDTEASLCTGTLIARNVVITAAHCLNNAKSARIVFDVDPVCNQEFDSNTQSIDVKKASIHPDYNEKVKGRYDLALLKLAKGAPAHYPVISLYNGTSERSSNTVTYAGYGRTSEGDEWNQALRSVTKNYNDSIFFAKNKNMVTSQSDGAGICQGDSGGPVFFEVGRKLQLAGVNSVVVGKSNSSVCRGASEAMYIPAHTTWIKKKLQDLNAYY